jgi:XTP/dITP diphosphohydrolase
MVQILLATNNPGKVREIQALIEELAPAYREQIKLVLPLDIGLHLEVNEDGQTYDENAARKASAFCRASNLVTVADDSGLEVTALGGAPGVHSHRYSTSPDATDTDRRAYLLRNLRQVTRPWRARFVCTIAIAEPEMHGFDPRLEYAYGECFGEIIPEERGSNGFGYDPIFLIKELGKSMAELSTQEKNLYSHRSRALHNAVPILIRIINE